MKNYEIYKILNYIYKNCDLKSTWSYNWAQIKWISSSKISESNTKFFSELKDYVLYENSRNNWLWRYLTEKWMNYVESNNSCISELELFMSDYPKVFNFFSWLIIWIATSIITYLLK